MSAANPKPSDRRFDVEQLRSRHENLYQSVQQAKDRLRTDSPEREQKLQDVNELIAKLAQLSSQIRRSHDYSQYDWLDSVTTKWQEVFSWILAEPRSIRTEIEMPDRPKRLIRSRERVERTDDLVRSDIAERAYRLGEERKMRALLARIRELEELQRGKDRIHTLVPSTNEEQREDWHSARVYFAADVLAGRPDFAYQLLVRPIA